MSKAGEIVVELKLDDNGMAVAVTRAGTALREFQQDMNRTAVAVTRLEKVQGSLSTKFRHLVMTLGNLRFVAMDINDIFLRLPASIMKSAGELERMQFLMTGLSKETTKAGKELEGLKNFDFVVNMSKTAPFDISALADSFVKLKVAGVDPTNGSLETLVDSVARFGGTSEILKRASIAIQQMSGKGVISMEELRQQIGEAVPTAMKNMADGMGVTMAELAKIVESGTLQAGPALAKMFLQMRVENEGAAAEMMKTWGGTLSRLKTEWELTTKFVADNGFGDAAKDAVREITKILSTKEFQTFASDAGAALGELITGVVSLVKTLYEFREEIKLGLAAWVAYKVIFSTIPQLSKAVGDGYDKLLAAGVKERGEMVKAAGQRRATMVLLLADAEARKAFSIQTLANYSQEMVASKAATASKLADEALLLANIKKRSVKGSLDSIRANMAANVADRVEIDKLRASTAALSATQKTLGVSMVQSGHAIRAQGMEARALTGQLSRLDNRTRAAAAGASVMAGATRTAGIAMTALGGPIGLVMIAVTALAALWASAGDAAEDAADRQRRAMNGLTDAKEQKKNIAAMNDAQDKYDSSLRVQAVGKKSEFSTDADEANRARVVARNLKTLNDLTQTVERGAASVRESESRDRVSSESLALKREISARTDASRLKIANFQKLNAEESNAARLAGGNAIALAKKLKTINNSYIKKEQDELISDMNARAETMRDAAAKAAILANPETNKTANKAELAAQSQLYSNFSEQAKQLEEEAKNAQRQQDQVVKIDGKKGAGDGSFDKNKGNKYEKFLKSLRVKAAGLKVELDGLLSEAAKADEVAQAIAEVNQLIENGDLDVKVDKKTTRAPTGPEKEIARNLVERTALMGVVAKDAKRMGDFVNKMAPDYQHALLVLEDPLGTVEQKRSNRFQEFLTGMSMDPEKLRAAAAEMKIEVGQYIKMLEEGSMRAKAIDLAVATKDVAKNVRALLEQNRIAGAELILDEKARAAEMYRIKEVTTLEQNAMALREAAALGVSTDALQAQFAEATRIRLAKMTQEARTPLERLAADWKLSLNKMDEASAGWANGFVDMIVSSASTGKLEFGGFARSVLADILKIQTQRTLSDPLNNIISQATSKLGGMLPDLRNNNGPGSGASAGEIPSEQAREMTRMAEASARLRGEFSDLASNGLKATTEGLATAVTARAQETMGSANFTSSVGTATSAVYAFANALNSSGGGGSGGVLGSLISAGISGMVGAPGSMTSANYSLGSGSSGLGLKMPSAFADGGIMSGMGSIPLRKYAAGGIARSPQMAMFGEGSMNEAYVPLPDGRSIPVTMKGGAQQAGNVTVNVINQSGTSVAAQQGTPRFDGKQMILDVVLTAANQPGGFRDGMKGAMR